MGHPPTGSTAYEREMSTPPTLLRRMTLLYLKLLPLSASSYYERVVERLARRITGHDHHVSPASWSPPPGHAGAHHHNGELELVIATADSTHPSARPTSSTFEVLHNCASHRLKHSRHCFTAPHNIYPLPSVLKLPAYRIVRAYGM